MAADDEIRIELDLPPWAARMNEMKEPIVFTADGPVPFSEASEKIRKQVQDSGQLRTFATGATRDTAEGKSEPWGFTSALAEQRFCEYMHRHRQQSDGELRDSDNWKKGIPADAYKHSLSRHVQDLRLILEGYPSQAREADLEEVLCAILFNVQGLLHEAVKARTGAPAPLPPAS